MSQRLTNLTALRQIGFSANRRLLGAGRISHDPIRGAQAFAELTTPILTPTGTRIPGLRVGDTRVHALLRALLTHWLLPHGLTHRDLRTLIAPLLGTTSKGVPRVSRHGLRVPQRPRQGFPAPLFGDDTRQRLSCFAEVTRRRRRCGRLSSPLPPDE